MIARDAASTARNPLYRAREACRGEEVTGDMVVDELRKIGFAWLLALGDVAFEQPEYLIDPNATKASLRAGYSAKTAAMIGAQNLRKLKVAEKIEKAQTMRAERCEVTGDMVVDELRKIGFAWLLASPFIGTLPEKARYRRLRGSSPST